MKVRLLAFAATAALVIAGLAGVALAKGGNHLTAQLRGTNEVPAAPASNRGRVEIRLNASTRKVCWDFTISKIDAPGFAAHIHKGAPGKAGPVFIPLGTKFKRQGCATAPKAAIKAVLAKPGAFYVNVHNQKHLGGAMRGQLHVDA
jgi:CHRD domain